MKILLTAAAAALVALMPLACNGGDGDGDSATLEEYFAELDQLQNAGDEQINSVPFPEIDPEAPLEESRQAFIDYFDAVVVAANEITDDIDALDPPDEASALHDDYVEALRGITEFANDYKDRVEGADSQQALAEVLLGDNEDDSINENIDATCIALQELADENQIEVDLECV